MEKQMQEIFLKYMEHHLPLREVVFRTLREVILLGGYQAGDRLMEIHLADAMGVSRTPIRDALHMLEDEGLVKILPRRGAIVAGISEKQLRDVLEVRKALEELAVELATYRIDGERLERLSQAEDRFEESMKTGDVNAIARADEEFHYIIPESTGNIQLIHLLTNFREQMYRYRVAFLRRKELYPDLLTEHQMILQRLKASDPIGAKAAIRIHIDRQQQIMLAEVHRNMETGGRK